MGYIMLLKRKHSPQAVVWQTSVRVEGKPYPVHNSVYLGLLDDKGRLVKGQNTEALSPEMLEGLKKKGIAVSDAPPAHRGRVGMFLKRIPLDGTASSIVQSVGTYRLFHHLADASGLLESLKVAFAEDAEAVFALVCQKLDLKLRSYLLKDWAEGSPFEQSCISMTPKCISSLLSRLPPHRLSFCEAWYSQCGRPEDLIEDSTHLCTYSSGMGRELEEYGWTHHSEHGRQQLNFKSLVAMDTSLPVHYRIYPGSINDIGTVMETSEEMSHIAPGCSVTYVSDSGYFSRMNMQLLLNAGSNFIIEANWDSKTLAILHDLRDKLQASGEMTLRSENYAYRYEPCEYEIDVSQENLYRSKCISKKANDCPKTSIVNGYVYYSELEGGEFREKIRTASLQWCEIFQNYSFKDKNQAQEWLDTSTHGWGRYILLSESSSGKLHAEVNFKTMKQDTETAGFHVILYSGSKRSAKEVLALNHGRDPVEKLWRKVKTDLNSSALCTKLDSVTEGQVFIVWCAAILQTLLTNKLKEAGLAHSVNEALLAFRKIRLTYFKGQPLPATLTKDAKQLIVGMEIENEFPEFANMLKDAISEREAQKNRCKGEKPGKHPKYMLKVQKDGRSGEQARIEENKAKALEERQRKQGSPPTR